MNDIEDDFVKRGDGRANCVRRGLPRLVTGRGEGILALPGKGAATAREESVKDLDPALRDPVRAVIESAAIARVSPSGKTMAFFTAEDHVEFWDLVTGRRRGRERVPGVEDVLAGDTGFFALAGDSVSFRTCPEDGKGPCTGSVLVEEGASGLVQDLDSVFVASGDLVHRYSVDGKHLGSIPGGLGLITLLHLEQTMILGFSDGSVEVRGQPGHADEGRTVLKDTPSGRAVVIRSVTDQVIAVGFGNGLVGLWNRDNGELLDSWKLHGPVTHMVIHEQYLYAASSAGGYMARDLGVFHRPYCELMEEIWQEIPVIWDGERPVRSHSDPDHECRAKLTVPAGSAKPWPG